MSGYWIGLGLIISTLLAIDYMSYRDGGKSIFHSDKTEIELLNREVQKLRLEAEKKELLKAIAEGGEG